MTPSRRLLTAVVACFTLTIAGGFAVSSPQMLTAARAHGLIRLSGAVPAAIRSGEAHRAGRVAANQSLTVNLGLPLRHRNYLRWFINHQASRGIYMTKRQFDREFAPTARHAARVVAWARNRGLRPSYVSGDHMIVAVTGSAKSVQRAFRVRVAQYSIHGHLRYANANAPAVPASLGIESITGLDNIRQATRVDIHRVATRHGAIPNGGLTPDAIRTAYDMNGHTVNASTIDGTGQTVGITGFGETVPNSDFADFASHVTGPVICDPTTGTCPHGSSVVWWDQIGGTVTNDPDIDEQALDVEYVHGLAPHVRVNYYLGQDGADWAMEQAIDKAASDPTIHVVSNSWGDPGWESSSGNNSFVTATKSYFEKAVATGTTFYFSTGDNAADSGCAGPNGQVTTCGLPSYPADSQYVVAVGGTNLQLNNSLTAWQSEATWNLSSGDWGSGGGCASFLSRPSWQKGVGTATCKGRAIPDISAAGDSDNSPVNVWDGGQSIEVGGTSVAASLISGMAIDTNSYLTLEHAADPSIPVAGQTTATCGNPAGSFCWMGWSGPEIYKLAQSPVYNADFHDVVCGSNTWPARYGWDQATGWGSLEWYNFSQSDAGQTVTPQAPVPSWTCTPGTGTLASLDAIACNPVFHCHFGGPSVLAYATDAWHWRWPSTALGHATVNAISCPSSTTCFAAMSSGWLQKTTDGGKTFKGIRLAISSPTGVACRSSTACVVVGSGIQTTSNGARFATRTNPAGHALVAISCSRSFCGAITSQGTVIESSNGGTTWQVANASTPPGTLSSISCPAAKTCIAVGSAALANPEAGNALVYSTTDGTDWTSQVIPGAATSLSGVSCAGTSICDAVGNGEVLRTLDGGATWNPIQATIPKVQINAITCPNKTMCFAVGASGRYFEIGASTGN